MSAIERILAKLDADGADHAGVTYVAITRGEFKAALADAWDAGAAKSDDVGMDAISLNPMHANPWRKP